MLYIILWHVYVVYKVYSTDIVLVTFMDVMTKYLRGEFKERRAYFDSQFKEFQSALIGKIWLQ